MPKNSNQLIKVHKIRLRPSPEQARLLRRACGAAKHAFNYGVAVLHTEYRLNRDLLKMGIPTATTPVIGKKSIRPGIKHKYNEIKPDWIKLPNGNATQEAFANLLSSLSKYFDDKKKGRIKPRILPNGKKSYYKKNGIPIGYPTFKTRHSNFSFRQNYPNVDDKFIQYNRKCGPIRMCEKFRFPFKSADDKFSSATFSFDGLYWYVSIVAWVTESIPEHPNPDKAVGVDLGIKYLAATSDGGIPVENPKALYKYLGRLRRMQRKLDRQRRANNPDNYDSKGSPKRGVKWVKSNAMAETELQVTKLHRRIKNIRLNASHQLTARLTDEFGIICLEDLNVSGMLKNKKLAKAIADASFFEKRRQFEYKTRNKGGITSIIDQWFPSSKMCRECKGINHELTLSDREWICYNCGSVNERDGNAAGNIEDEGVRILG